MITARKTVFLAGLVLAFALWLPGEPADAASIDCDAAAATDTACQGSRVVIGSDLSIFSFTIEEGGWHQANLFDYEWPSEPLAELRLLLSTSDNVIGSLDMAGSLLFFAAPDRYFLQVYAAAADAASVGLYGVNVQATLVPLPPAMILMLSGLAVVGVATRRARIGAGAAGRALA